MFDVLEHDCFPGPEPGKRSGPKRHVILDTGEYARRTMRGVTSRRDGGHDSFGESESCVCAGSDFFLGPES